METVKIFKAFQHDTRLKQLNDSQTHKIIEKEYDIPKSQILSCIKIYQVNLSDFPNLYTSDKQQEYFKHTYEVDIKSESLNLRTTIKNKDDVKIIEALLDHIKANI